MREVSKVDVETWPNAKVGLVGFLIGRGVTRGEIAKLLGVGEGSLFARWRQWAVLPGHSRPRQDRPGHPSKNVLVTIPKYQRRKLVKLAKREGLTPEEWVRRVAGAALADDLYGVITDGKFDLKKGAAERGPRGPSRGHIGRTAADRDAPARMSGR